MPEDVAQNAPFRSLTCFRRRPRVNKIFAIKVIRDLWFLFGGNGNPRHASTQREKYNDADTHGPEKFSRVEGEPRPLIVGLRCGILFDFYRALPVAMAVAAVQVKQLCSPLLMFFFKTHLIPLLIAPTDRHPIGQALATLPAV